MESSGWKPSDDDDDDHHHICPNCPRCGCSNTKFCYYNNYSLTQPRYFCKGCRRYWTKGGSLRNVPVGGGCRKNRRGSRSLRLSATHTGSNNSNVHSGTSSSYGNGISTSSDNNNNPDSTSSGVSNQDASPRIDLAVVYANFLNQNPDSNNNSSGTSDHQLPELPGEFDPAGLDFSSCIANMNINGSSSAGSSVQLMEGNNGLIGSLGCHASLSDNDNMYFGGGLDDPLLVGHHHHHYQKHHQHRSSDLVQYATSTHDQSATDFGLPPLPDQEVMWSSSSHHQDQIMVSSMMQASPLLGSEATTDPNLLNWSPLFDLPCSGTFSRT